MMHDTESNCYGQCYLRREQRSRQAKDKMLAATKIGVGQTESLESKLENAVHHCLIDSKLSSLHLSLIS